MTVSSGFFNSVNHDRLYDAEQMSSIFDGIIEDGVYESIGEAFMVTAYADANDTVIVGTGRAWFDHTWTLNDTQFSITLSPPNTLLGRIDSIVIDVDRRDTVRKNSIILVEGEYTETPVAPTLINEELHKQYPIANIKVDAGVSGPVSQSKITYLVGSDPCPIVTGPLEAFNISNYFQQMESEFDTWHSDIKEEWENWYQGVKDVFDDLTEGKINLTTSVDDVTIEFTEQKLRVKDRGITQPKLSFELQSVIGILDPSSWGYEEYYEFIQTIPSTTQEETFVDQYCTQDVLKTWTYGNVESFYTVLKSSTSKNTVYSRVPWDNYKLSGLRHLVEFFGSSHYSEAVGRTVPISMGSLGTHSFRIIGINHDNLASGGKALLTLECVDIPYVQTIGTWGDIGDNQYKYSTTPLRTAMASLYDYFDADTKSVIKLASIYERWGSRSNSTGDQLYDQIFEDYVWPINQYEQDDRLDSWGTEAINLSVYDWWSKNFQSESSSAPRIKNYNGVPHTYLLRYWQSYNTYGCVTETGGTDEYVNLNNNSREIGFSPLICC